MQNPVAVGSLTQICLLSPLCHAWGTSQEAVTSQSLRAACSVLLLMWAMVLFMK